MSSPQADFVLYGAYGYTGQLIAREAIAKGLRPFLSGRNAAKLQTMAEELDLPFGECRIDDQESLKAMLSKHPLVIHCAGPFADTAERMMRACIATGTHYLDITGEYQVFELAARLGAEALKAGVILLPGVGFDVVPSDCLAAHLKSMLPDATHLELAFESGKGGVSRGTALTMVRNLPEGGVVRQEGKIKQVPAAYKTRFVDFGQGEKYSFSIPWGDVSTAYHSTGIPNIIVYTAAPPKMVQRLKLTRYLGWFLGLGFMQRYMERKVRSTVTGPGEEHLQEGTNRLWGQVRNAEGQTATARLLTPNGYTLTALCAVAIARKVLGGLAAKGFQTPSMALGKDFILTIPGTERSN